MKNVFLVMIAALTLAACGGNKSKTAKSDSCQPGVGTCPVNQAVQPVGVPHVQVGAGHYGGNYAGNDGSIVGSWCSIDSQIRFDQDGAVALTRTNGSVHFGRYTQTTGALIIGGNVVPVKIAPASANSPALLYMTLSVGYTEVMEPCEDQNQEHDDKEEDDKEEEESKPWPTPKPKPKPQPKPQPTPLPEAPKAT